MTRNPSPQPIDDLSPWLWLWLPLCLYFVHYPAAVLLGHTTYNSWFPSESGLTEQFTVVFALFGTILGIAIVVPALRAGQYWLAGWFLAFVAGCIYFGGEEASWGQHWFGWHTAQGWAHLNDQSESNLHNLDGILGDLFDQLPRNLLTFGALIAGGIMPWVRRRRGRVLDPAGRAYWLLPTLVCVPAGLIAGLASLPEKLQQAAFGKGHLLVNIEAGEVKELMLAFFLMLYAASVLQRYRQWRTMT